MHKVVRADIRRNIKLYGVALRAISDAAPCQSCGDTPCEPHAKGAFTELEDGFVYSIGHRERNRPDLVVLCGPTPGEPALDQAGLVNRMQEAATLINYLVSRWGEHPVLPGQRCADSDGRVYRVLSSAEVVSAAKDELTVQAGVYYGTEDYELLVLMPETAQATQATQATPTRH